MRLEFVPKPVGSGCLIHDDFGRTLLVKPTYKPGWEIPGGTVEANESPSQTCTCEV
jgi:8-oxo-dGTP diphosphatase